METVLAIVAGGFLLGLAGSLHCACMCGGIATGALFVLQPTAGRERLIVTLLLQAGRIATYAIAGGAVSGIVTLAIDPSTTAISFRVLQWLGAVALMWTGLATAGLLPGPALVTTGQGLLVGLAGRVLGPLRDHPRLGPLGLGLSWGLMPCPMVYAALFSAALTGSFWLGALWMLAFGAGTMPGVVGAALGISALSELRRNPAAELAAGLAIALFGFSTLYFGWPGLGGICVTR